VVLVDDNQISAIKKADLEEYSKAWDLTKGWSLKNNIPFQNHECMGLFIHLSALEKLDDLKIMYGVARELRLHILFVAIESIIDEYEMHTGTNADWVYLALGAVLEPDFETEQEKWLIGLFILRLSQCGSKKSNAERAYADWQIKSETKCRDAFLDVQRLYKVAPAFFERSYWQVKILKHIQESKPFPSNDMDVYQAYLKMASQLSSYEEHRKNESHRASQIIDQAFPGRVRK
jgi:hypothetical protein